ncbi:MAG: hypothetical protein DDT35_01217 [Firmicutes bacterium]|nr:hypothetical protein [Bacillota bacterium]
MQHPPRQKRSPARNNVHQSALCPEEGHDFFGDATVHSDKIGAVLTMLADTVKDIVASDLPQAPVLPLGVHHHLVQRYGADHDRAGFDYFSPDAVDVPSGAEVHDGMRARF